MPTKELTMAVLFPIVWALFPTDGIDNMPFLPSLTINQTTSLDWGGSYPGSNSSPSIAMAAIVVVTEKMSLIAMLLLPKWFRKGSMWSFGLL
jgi:hypothetical protein